MASCGVNESAPSAPPPSPSPTVLLLLLSLPAAPPPAFHGSHPLILMMIYNLSLIYCYINDSMDVDVGILIPDRFGRHRHLHHLSSACIDAYL